MRRFAAVLIVTSLACSAPFGGRDDAAQAAGAPAQENYPVIDHVAPKRDSTGGVPPKFEWTGIKGADGYIISLWNDIDVLLWRQHVTGTSVDWPERLKVEEGTYFWDVAATRSDQIVGSSGRAAFVVLDRK